MMESLRDTKHPAVVSLAAYTNVAHQYTENTMRPKADTPAPPTQPAERGVSGKFVIMGILGLALVAASGSWLFRYNATHRAAEYFEPANVIAIRDAPKVTFATYAEPLTLRIPTIWFLPITFEQWLAEQPHTSTDVTSAHGLVHLRNALLEDQSYDWDADSTNPVPAAAAAWKHSLVFEDTTTGHRTYVLFAPESKLLKEADRTFPLSYQPIESGIAEMLAEFASLPVSQADSTSR
jgi:hypothetical protein